MKRLFRILLHTATMASLLLCVATISLWVRSLVVRDSLDRETTWSGRDWLVIESLESTNGAISFTSFENSCPVWAKDGPLNPWAWTVQPRQQAVPEPRALWFQLRWTNNEFYIVVPYWPILAASVPLPALYVVGVRRKRRVARVGHCLTCGYDLRATPERCPECGTIAPKLQA